MSNNNNNSPCLSNSTYNRTPRVADDFSDKYIFSTLRSLKVFLQLILESLDFIWAQNIVDNLNLTCGIRCRNFLLSKFNMSTWLDGLNNFSPLGNILYQQRYFSSYRPFCNKKCCHMLEGLVPGVIFVRIFLLLTPTFWHISTNIWQVSNIRPLIRR